MRVESKESLTQLGKQWTDSQTLMTDKLTDTLKTSAKAKFKRI